MKHVRRVKSVTLYSHVQLRLVSPAIRCFVQNDTHQLNSAVDQKNIQTRHVYYSSNDVIVYRSRCPCSRIKVFILCYYKAMLLIT